MSVLTSFIDPAHLRVCWGKGIKVSAGWRKPMDRHVGSTLFSSYFNGSVVNLNNLKYPITAKREKQIKKILKYGKDILNIDVQFKSRKEMGTDAGGYVAPSGKEKGLVTVDSSYKGPMIILILLHEFGHHIDFLKRGYQKEEDEAYAYYPDKKEDAPCPQKYAKKIRFVEDQAIKYAMELAIYLDLKMPRFMMLKDMYYTKLMLEAYLEEGWTNREGRAIIRKKSFKLAKEQIKSERKRNN